MNRIRRTRLRRWTKSRRRSFARGMTTSIATTFALVGGYALILPTSAVAQSAPSVTYPVLSEGSTGDSVSRLQATLKLLGFYTGPINGNYNTSTQAAVAQFQTAAGIPADGITGSSTWQKLLPTPSDLSSAATVQPVVRAEPVADDAPAPTPAEPSAEQPQAQPQGPPILRPNVEGSAVSQLQRELQQLGYYDGEIDGVYGDLTQSAVKNFQSDKGLEVDAIVGPSTWEALTQALS